MNLRIINSRRPGSALASLATIVVMCAGVSGPAQAQYGQLVELGFPPPAEGELVHVPPSLDDLEEADIHPELKKVIRRGRDLFVNTQQLRGKNIFNDLNCSSCHLDEGRLPFSAPVWAAAVTLPDFRGKNRHVNSLEERIAGCFAYSMNGIPPEYGSDDMLAISAYHQWLASGAPMYPDRPIYGRGYPPPKRPESLSYERGEQGYQDHCAICHGADGAGHYENGEYVFPALWGDGSYNWGAGIVRVNTAAGMIKHNMPLGQPNSLTDQQAWDIAYYINSQERPQDPRYRGSVDEVLERFSDTFHRHTRYGEIREHDGHRLGDHENWGEKGDRVPWNIGVSRFENLDD